MTTAANKLAIETEAAAPQVPLRHADAPGAGRQLLGTPLICRRLGIERHTWRRWVLSGKAPAPIPNVPGHPRWRVRDIEDFVRGAYGTGRYFVSARGR